MIKLTTNQVHRDRLQETAANADKYIVLGQEIVALKNQIFPLQPKTPTAEISDAAISKIASLTSEAERIARERTSPIAQQMNKVIDEISEEANKLADEADAEAAQVMATAERASFGLSVLAILLLIGTAAFGVVSIARPLRALVRPLEDLASGNFAVTVPGIGRKDEVGQIAEAVRLDGGARSGRP